MKTKGLKKYSGVLGNQKVLSSTLNWVSVEELKVGERILAFNEGKSPFLPYRDQNGDWLGQGSNRDVRLTSVTKIVKEKLPAMSILFSDGSIQIAPKEGFWMGKVSKRGVLTWIKTKDLVRRNAHIAKYMNVWYPDKSYNAGWLAGFMDGEGSLVFSNGKNLSGMQACQRPTSVWDRALSLFTHYGIKHSEPKIKKNSGGKGDCEYIYTNGKWDTLEFIGKLDVIRFKDTILERPSCYGTLTSCSRPTLTVKDVVDIGDVEFYNVKTESNTYFCDGFARYV